jgi:hypothetical protein
MRTSKGAIKRAEKRFKPIMARNPQKLIAQGAKATYEVKPVYKPVCYPLTNEQRKYLREGTQLRRTFVFPIRDEPVLELEA